MTAEPARDYLEQFAARVLRDALNEATPAYWTRRAAQLEAARPVQGEFHGQATREQLSERWQRLTQDARACRSRAAFAALYPPTTIDPIVWQALREAA